MTLTIGVAIPVPEPWGTQLRNKRASFGDPMAETVPTHVTLIPPTVIAKVALDDVSDALDRAALQLAPFPMRLRGTGTFRPVSPVVFIAVSQGISYTELLASAVRKRLDVPESEFPFHPHVTIAQNVPDDALDQAYNDLADFECDFRVDDFALYTHAENEGWTPQRHFSLGG